jgi:hypothetical protein
MATTTCPIARPPAAMASPLCRSAQLTTAVTSETLTSVRTISEMASTIAEPSAAPTPPMKLAAISPIHWPMRPPGPRSTLSSCANGRCSSTVPEAKMPNTPKTSLNPLCNGRPRKQRIATIKNAATSG